MISWPGWLRRYAKDMEQRGTGSPNTLRQIAVHLEQQDAKIARLEAALKPFAECARVFDPDMVGGTMPKTGEWQSWPRMVDGKYHVYMLTVEHLREARDAIREDGQ